MNDVKIVHCRYFDSKLVEKNNWYEVYFLKKSFWFWNRWVPAKRWLFDSGGGSYITERFSSIDEVSAYIDKHRTIKPQSTVREIVSLER